MTKDVSLGEALRRRADRLHYPGHKCSSPPCPFEEEAAELRAAADELDRLMRVYAAAADFVDDPFGSLDQRKFYALRESFYPTRDA